MKQPTWARALFSTLRRWVERPLVYVFRRAWPPAPAPEPPPPAWLDAALEQRRARASMQLDVAAHRAAERLDRDGGRIALAIVTSSADGRWPLPPVRRDDPS